MTIIYVGHLTESRKQLLKQISVVSKVARQKINMQKPTVYLCSTNKQPEIEILKILFTITFKNKNYLEINLTKDK